MMKLVYNLFSKRVIRIVYVGIAAIVLASTFVIWLNVYSRTDEDSNPQSTFKLDPLRFGIKDISVEINDAPVSKSISVKAGEKVSMRVSLTMDLQPFPKEEVCFHVLKDEAYGRRTFVGSVNQMTLSERDGRLEATAPGTISAPAGQYWLCLYYETQKSSRGIWRSVPIWLSQLHVVK